MNKWAARLAAKVAQTPPEVTDKTDKSPAAPLLSVLSVPGEGVTGNIGGANAIPSTGQPGRSALDRSSAESINRWLLRFADGEQRLVTCVPAVSHAGALASYPDALAAESMPFDKPVPPTAAQERTLGGPGLRLLHAIARHRQIDADDLDRVVAEVADDSSAMDFWEQTATAGERAEAEADDRRVCVECRHLQSGGCTRWQAAGFVRPARGVPGVLIRCGAFGGRAS